MTEEPNFNDVFFNDGSFFDITQSGMTKASTRVLFNIMSEVQVEINKVRINYPSLPHVDFQFINDMEFNAFASKLEVNNQDQYLIGFNMGAFLLLKEMFLKMLSSRDILTDIGNV